MRNTFHLQASIYHLFLLICLWYSSWNFFDISVIFFIRRPYPTTHSSRKSQRLPKMVSFNQMNMVSLKLPNMVSLNRSFWFGCLSTVFLRQKYQSLFKTALPPMLIYVGDPYKCGSKVSYCWIHQNNICQPCGITDP